MTNQVRRRFLATMLVAAASLFGCQVGQPIAMGRSDAPLIGIASLTNHSYVRAIRAAGGVPVVLPNAEGGAEQIDSYLGRLDGLLLPGGADIPPSEYGEQTHETVRLLGDDRFVFEKALSRAWIEKTNKPLLGICLGSQWINVASGGSLVQDIPSEFGISHRNRDHDVILEADSKLAGILGSTRFEVNSFHHQAVRSIGANLRIVARCPDGVVEATETTDPERFLIGVQWHPEQLVPDDERQAMLLRAFVAAAREHSAVAGGVLSNSAGQN